MRCAPEAYDTGWGRDRFSQTIGFGLSKSPRFDHLTKEDTGFIGFKTWNKLLSIPLEENRRHSTAKVGLSDKVLIGAIMGKIGSSETARRLKAGADMIDVTSCPQMTSRHGKRWQG